MTPLILVHTPDGDGHIPADRAKALGIRPGQHIDWDQWSEALDLPRTRGPVVERGWFDLLWRWGRS